MMPPADEARPRSHWLLAVVLTSTACATLGSSSGGPTVTSSEDPAPHAGIPTLLIAMPESAEFVAVRRALVAEVTKSFNIVTLLVTRETSAADFAVAIDRVHPVCAVLMDNATVNLFHAYESAHRDKPALPTVVVMVSLLDEARSQLRRATGISYEVPAVTAFVNLRAILENPIRRIGVVYRPVFKQFVARQQAPAEREHLSILARELPHDFSADDLRNALHALVTEDHVDALWMLNDNLLLRDAEFLDETWRAELRAAKLPLVVGAANLIDPSSVLGTLAVVPDHESLGLQASNLIFDLADNGWQAEQHAIDPPLSVKTVVDLRHARSLFRLRSDAIGRIDRPLE